LDYFREALDRAGGDNYQTVINAVLREYLEGKKAAQIEEIALPEELRKAPSSRGRRMADSRSIKPVFGHL
jgi:hypothetical protein